MFKKEKEILKLETKENKQNKQNKERNKEQKKEQNKEQKIIFETKYKTKHKIILITIYTIIIYLSISLNLKTYARYPELISRIRTGFDKVQGYIIAIATPAAGVAISTGLIMRKFSFGDEERVRTAKKLIRGSIFSYIFIILIDLVISLIATIMGK